MPVNTLYIISEIQLYVQVDTVNKHVYEWPVNQKTWKCDWFLADACLTPFNAELQNGLFQFWNMNSLYELLGWIALNIHTCIWQMSKI